MSVPNFNIVCYTLLGLSLLILFPHATKVAASPSTEPQERSGLYVSGGGAPIPLVGVRVSTELRDFTAHVNVEQHYRNVEENPINAEFVFPLDVRSAIHSFQAYVDGKQLIGKLMQKDDAKATYDEAINRGDGAYLMAQDKPNLFVMNVGNLPPKQSVVLKFSYVSELVPELADGVRFVLPMTIFPHYTPMADSPFPQDDPTVLNSANMTSYITEIIPTPGHADKLDVEVKGKEALIKSKKDLHMGENMVLVVRMKPEDIRNNSPKVLKEVLNSTDPSLQTDRIPAPVALALNFWPNFDFHQETQSELIFVLDRSGSMQGASIVQAKVTMLQILKHLPKTATFNIIGFGSSWESLFSVPQPCDDVNIDKARKHIASIDADLGGTEIFSPLQHILQMPPSNQHIRQLFVLSDGEVSNADEVINLVKQHADKNRVYTFGIGNYVDHLLIEGMAKAGNGKAVFTEAGDSSLEGKVIDQLHKATQPALDSISLVWKNKDGKVLDPSAIQIAPRILPPIFNKELYTVYALVGDQFDFDTVTMTATGPAGEYSFTLKPSVDYETVGSTIHRLAARSLIRELEEGQQTSETVAEILNLALTYQLASSETSFIVVEVRENGEHRPIAERKVPSTIPTYAGEAFSYMAQEYSTDDIVLMDITPLGLGFEVDGGVMEFVLPRSSFIPTRKSRIISTSKDNDDRAIIKVYEGERALVKDNWVLGELELKGIPPAPRGVPRIEVTFEIDVNGILHVSAEDQGTGNREKITITNDGRRFSEEDIRDILTQAEGAEEEDRKVRDTHAAFSLLENYIYQTRDTINDDAELSSKITADDKSVVDRAVNEAIDWLANNPITTASDPSVYEKKLKEFESTVQPIFNKHVLLLSGSPPALLGA